MCLEGRGGGSSSSSRVRVNPGGFELFDTSLNWHRTSASEGMGGGKFEFEFEVGKIFFFWRGGGGVRVRVRGFELSSFEGRGEEFEFEFYLGSHLDSKNKAGGRLCHLALNRGFGLENGFGPVKT